MKWTWTKSCSLSGLFQSFKNNVLVQFRWAQKELFFVSIQFCFDTHHQVHVTHLYKLYYGAANRVVLISGRFHRHMDRRVISERARIRNPGDHVALPQVQGAQEPAPPRLRRAQGEANQREAHQRIPGRALVVGFRTSVKLSSLCFAISMKLFVDIVAKVCFHIC